MELPAFLAKYDNGAGWFNLANNKTISRAEVEAAGGMDDLIRDMAALSRDDQAKVLAMFERYSLTGGAISAGDRARAAGLQAPQGTAVQLRGQQAPQRTDFIDLERLVDAVELYRTTGQIPPAALLDLSERPRETRPPEGHVINQLDARYATANLGRSRFSIKSRGCLLASFTMVANRLRNTSLDLIQANDLLRRNGGFSGASMVTGAGAEALGLRIESRQPATRAAMDRAVPELDDGKLLVAGVDYKRGRRSSMMSEADHFVVITGRDAASGRLFAVDPAGGREIVFTRQADGSYRSGKYRIAEVMVMSAPAQPPVS